MSTLRTLALSIGLGVASPFPSPRRAFADASVETAYERGWATLQNGALLAAADDAGCDSAALFRMKKCNAALDCAEPRREDCPGRPGR